MASTSQQKPGSSGGIAVGIAAILIAIVALSGGKSSPPKTTTTTVKPAVTTTTEKVAPPSSTIAPSGGDDTDAFVAAVAAGNVTVDRPLTINKVARITTSNRTITFTGTGQLRRTTSTNPTGDNVTFPVLLLVGVSNVTVTNPQIVGPGGVCDVPRPNNAGPPFRALYDARYEESAGITLEGVADVKITGGTIRDVRGDGVKVFYDHTVNPSRPSSRVTITDLTTRCVGRAAIANISSDAVTVTRGDFALSGFWTFNVEPFNTQAVTNYRIDQPKIGYSTSSWLFVGGPYFQCVASGNVNKPTFTELVMGENIAQCVRPTFTVTR